MFSGFVIKIGNEYYCENDDIHWYLDNSLQFACIFQTIEEVKELADKRFSEIGVEIIEVEYEVRIK